MPDPRILLVCTGNICRSPMAEAILRSRLAAAGVRAEVTSAGVLTAGAPADRWAQAAVASLGADLTTHRSRVLEPQLLADADLVIGMAREHVREAVTLHPEAWPRTFTLKDLVRRARTTGARPPTTSLEAWLRLLHHGRELSQLLGQSRRDDLEDPLGQGEDVFRERAEEIAGLVDELVGYVWGSAASEASAGFAGPSSA